jgi:hypothetical protein
LSRPCPEVLETTLNSSVVLGYGAIEIVQLDSLDVEIKACLRLTTLETSEESVSTLETSEENVTTLETSEDQISYASTLGTSRSQK